MLTKGIPLKNINTQKYNNDNKKLYKDSHLDYKINTLREQISLEHIYKVTI